MRQRRRRDGKEFHPSFFISHSLAFFILCSFAFWALLQLSLSLSLSKFASRIYFMGSNYHLNKYLYIIFKWILNGQHVSKLLLIFLHHYIHMHTTLLLMPMCGLWVLFVWYFHHQFISIKEWNLFYFSAMRIYFSDMWEKNSKLGRQAGEGKAWEIENRF